MIEPKKHQETNAKKPFVNLTLISFLLLTAGCTVIENIGCKIGSSDACERRQNRLDQMEFVQTCKNLNAPVEALNTVRQLLKRAENQDCEKANELLNRFTTIDLSDSGISDINPLRSFKNAKELLLGGNNIVDVSPLYRLRNLEKLSLRENKIQDISGIDRLSRLSHLSLRSNQIVDVSKISELSNLKYLNFNKNRVKNINALSSLKKLERVSASENEIEIPLEEIGNKNEANMNKQLAEIYDYLNRTQQKSCKDASWILSLPGINAGVRLSTRNTDTDWSENQDIFFQSIGLSKLAGLPHSVDVLSTSTISLICSSDIPVAIEFRNVNQALVKSLSAALVTRGHKLQTKSLENRKNVCKPDEYGIPDYLCLEEARKKFSLFASSSKNEVREQAFFYGDEKSSDVTLSVSKIPLKSLYHEILTQKL